MLAVLLATRLWYPGDLVLARNDAVTLAAVLIQVLLMLCRLETLRELRVIVLFHIVSTGMELFKTSVGSWIYSGEGLLHLGHVPLDSGFMYAAVGSYMVRVFRLFDLRFERYPCRWATAVLAGAIYLNFFSHHPIVDLRWLLLAAVLMVLDRSWMHFRVFRLRLRMSLVLIVRAGGPVHLVRREHRHLVQCLGLSRPARRLAIRLHQQARVLVVAHDHLGGAGDVGLPAPGTGPGTRPAGHPWRDPPRREARWPVPGRPKR